MLPVIGALLANALPLLANAVLAKGTSYVKEKTGVDLAVGTPPTQEQLVLLKKYEMEHEEELMRLRLEENKLDLEEDKLRYADLGDARAREMAMANSRTASWLQKNTGALLALGTVILTFVLFVYFTCTDITEPNRKDIVIYILGVLSTISTQIFSYYFGSSEGSSQKNTTINGILQRMEGGKQ